MHIDTLVYSALNNKMITLRCWTMLGFGDWELKTIWLVYNYISLNHEDKKLGKQSNAQLQSIWKSVQNYRWPSEYFKIFNFGEHKLKSCNFISNSKAEFFFSCVHIVNYHH